MFSSLGLFQTLACPEKDTCTRRPCVFSHRADLPAPLPLSIQVRDSTQPSSSKSTIPSKRAVPASPHRVGSAPPTPNGEPPRKLQKLGVKQRPLPVLTSSHTDTGVPVLRVNAAQSQVAIPVRQTMLKTLYDHFVVLYQKVLQASPTIASEHALKQEDEIYKKSSKLTYRNAIIQCAAALKRRPIPDSLSHASVGTEAELTARAESRKAINSLRITRSHMEPYLLSMEEMVKWGYFVQIPDGPGGHEPSLEGKIAKCERCSQPFQVKRQEEADVCIHHWGKPYTTVMNGEKTRLYNCCSRPVADSEGCTHGPHVFYESKAEDLHARYPFSHLQPGTASSTALDVAAIDCEMIYTTAGMRVARVSVVDGSGMEVFDELVRMDAGVEVIDYITRFSGITAENHAKAILPLASIRKSLDSFISAETVLIGHALDNDLKTLRIIHHKCVDTVALFPHRAGPPYRRSLRDLVRENLGILIQTGDASVGHSSVEDAVATLDLVRWHILNKPKPKPKPSPTSVALNVNDNQT
ncbi:Exonuclease GOR [Hypsizygus marmoreus]|uniref:Exonuclease GOR n=1 Tax=Hypsizygus marmoreus TaxID=39966 RepID=A0A369JJS8_HYPMA|nr:Exonuclease GOR [Hypsizygus marmoreus]